jgi:hypothetical protein
MTALIIVGLICALEIGVSVAYDQAFDVIDPPEADQ